MDWSLVKKEHIEQAIKKFIDERAEYPEPKSYYLKYEGVELPSKYIRGMAYAIATGEPLNLKGFNGGKDTVRFFKQHEYEVVEETQNDLYNIEQIRERITDLGIDGKNISSNMVQLGARGTTICRTKTNGIIFYATDRDYEKITSCEELYDDIVLFENISISKEELTEGIEKAKEENIDSVICSRRGNKIINPSSAGNYNPNEIRIYTNDNFDIVFELLTGGEMQSGKYSVNDAVWIATALLAMEKYTNNLNVSKNDMYFKQSEIVHRAQEYAEKNVDAARVSWWVNADHEKATQKYLRADKTDDSSARRLSMMDEFDEKAYPIGLNMEDTVIVNGSPYSLEKLFAFVKELYPEILKKTSMKPTYLLTWNPASWDWKNYKSDCISSQAGNRIEIEWTCASKQPKIGDEVYLMKTGDQPRGIMAHGYVIKESYEAPHYDPKKAAEGKMASHIEVEYDWVVDTDEDAFILQDGLRIVMPDQDWSPTGSGISIKDEYLSELNDMWLRVKNKTFDNAAVFIGLSFDIEKIVNYINQYGGKKYVKPEKAGLQAAGMTEFKNVGTEAREEFISLGNMVQKFLPGYELGKSTGWVNQHQDACTYFWIEFKKKYATDLPHSISMSINKHPEYDPDGPITLSFRVEAKDMSCEAEDYHFHNRIVEIPIKSGSGIYYQAKLKSEIAEKYETDAQKVVTENEAGNLVKLKTVKPVAGPYKNTRSNDIIIDSVKAANSLRDFYEYILKLRGVKPESGGESSNMEIKNKNLGLNTILYGPPGTGKTYNTVIYAVAICGEDGTLEEVQAKAKEDYDSVKDKYNKLKASGRIAFTTFHQSYGYEEFIEGIRPIMSADEDGTGSEELKYKIEPGIFKKFCDKAAKRIVQKGDGFMLKEDPVVWNVHLDEINNLNLRHQCFSEGTIRIGWREFGKIITADTQKLGRNERSTLLYFQNAMEIGDIVVSFRTQKSIDGIGVITGDYEFDDTNQAFPRKRTVKWLSTGKEMSVYALNENTKLDMNSVSYTHMKASDVLALVGDENSDIVVKTEDKPYVFIIDEINRGNISKIFGELITLIEDTKRLGQDEWAVASLPYSGEEFGVPSNVYILGTMNTADRSIALMDTALRRRFDFIEMMPKSGLLRDVVVTKDGKSVNIGSMLDIINQRIEFLFDREHTIGHAFFMKLIKEENPSVDTLASIFKKSVIPLLQEYFYEDYEKIRLVLGDTGKEEKYQFITKDTITPSALFRGYSHLEKTEKYVINDGSGKGDAFKEIESYIGIFMETAKSEE